MAIARSSRTARMAQLMADGFDHCRFVGMGSQIRVGCSQCEAVVINGVPCHETGCPHQTFECKGCNVRVSHRGAYCADCQ